MPSSWRGHLWTIGPALRGVVLPRARAGERPTTFEVPDATFGRVTLSGWLNPSTRRDALLLIVHGLGGSADSPYMLDAVRAGQAAGFATLRLNLRGADDDGDDVYHAALYQDLAAVLRHPTLASFRDVVVVGYSLGGHVALRLAGAEVEPRMRAVAAIGSPLDLAASCRVIDRRRAYPYRAYILHALKRMYDRVAAQGRALSDPARVRRVRTLRDWDEQVVVIRHGFHDADDYYAKASVGPHLADLSIPALYVGAQHDPMVPPHAVGPSLHAAGDAVHVRWLDHGGHVGFPRTAYAGRAVEAQVMRWLADPDRPPP